MSHTFNLKAHLLETKDFFVYAEDLSQNLDLCFELTEKERFSVWEKINCFIHDGLELMATYT